MPAIRRIVIVGGGTAGWLCALMLSKYLREMCAAAAQPGLDGDGDVQITVVESKTIGTIGVGEGTTAVFSSMLQALGIAETEFLAQTGATIKYGIKHRDWRRLNHIYDGPIDDPHLVTEFTGDIPWLDVAAVASGKPLSQHHLFHYLLNLNKGPMAHVNQKQTVPVGPFLYAYHFDQARVGEFLHSKAQDIEHIDATIATVQRDATDNITALVTDADQRIVGDFFFDCTGFRRHLIHEHQQYGWMSYASDLPVNRAMPFWLPHDTNKPLPPYTLAWAQRSGWLWAIPTQERMGCGYVYCDAFTSPDEAQAEIETVLDHPIEPRNDLRFDSGRLEKSWLGNCIALGLSSSFLEPLEATSIHGTVVQLMLLLQNHVSTDGQQLSFTNSDDYNATVGRQIDEFRDFINLHYISERDDSPFWQHVSESCITDSNRKRVSSWSTSMPRKRDFSPLPANLPHVEEQLYYPVLDGLGLLNQSSAKALMQEHSDQRAHIRATHKQLTTEYRRAALKAMDHGQYLSGL